MEQALVYQYPTKIKVPPGLKTIIEGLSRAVVQRQPESLPHFATLYFAELLRFRTARSKEGIQGLVKQFHETRVDRLPNRGLGTMKDVKTKKLAAVATAALFTVHAHQLKSQQISGTIPAKLKNDDKEQSVSIQEILSEPPAAPVEHQSLYSPPRIKHKAPMPPKDSRLKKGVDLTQEVSAGAAPESSEQEAGVATKPLARKKKDKCKLVKPEVPTDEPDLDVSLVINLVNPLESLTQEETTHLTHLSGPPVSTGPEAKTSHLVYPPVPAEEEVVATVQQTVPLSQHRPTDGSFVEGSDFLLELESELAADHSSATVLASDPQQLSLSPSGRMENQGDYKLVRPTAPAEDPQLCGVTNIEWTPPEMEEDVISELIDKQLKRLLSARPKKVNNVKVTASSISQQKLTLSSALNQDSEGKPQNIDPKLTQIETGPRQLPCSSQKDSECSAIEEPQVPSTQVAQQMLYWAFPVPYVLLAGGYLSQNADLTIAPGTTVSPTTEEPLQPLTVELKPPLYAFSTTPGTVQFTPSAGIPTMLFPFMRPQTCGSWPAAQPPSAETPAGQPRTADHPQPCQASQKTPQASPDQGPMAANQKCSTCPQMPIVTLAPIPCALSPVPTGCQHPAHESCSNSL
ncbi:calcium-binding tyrosine phosphorylation-regulated protein-like isoform X1 [Alosa alosa]|uniref:calcium-binding tyrosine phosphorylation-regulated protein-like isoform X1 n=1 Tax=Alosa alosa TaxID=278164 RepID=UPI0020151642|nr:calcium-binding tyrosine phosphorylation-regulated protein-like isoform X1 [Alosa alosa]